METAMRLDFADEYGKNASICRECFLPVGVTSCRIIEASGRIQSNEKYKGDTLFQGN